MNAGKFAVPQFLLPYVDMVRNGEGKGTDGAVGENLGEQTHFSRDAAINKGINHSGVSAAGKEVGV